MTLDQLIGDTYHMVNGGMKGDAIRKAKQCLVSDPDLRAAAQERLGSLTELINVRGRRACHVSSIAFDVLSAALA